jgi:hypothetical protein
MKSPEIENEELPGNLENKDCLPCASSIEVDWPGIEVPTLNA